MTDQLAIIQEGLKQLYGPDHYYTKVYSYHERMYWGDIPLWMAEFIQKRHKVLDIGPGYGTLAGLASILSDEWVSTVDRTLYLSSAAAEYVRAIPAEMDIERQDIPSKEPKFDVIIMTEVLEHFNFNPIGTMRQIREHMQPTARLYLSTPDARSWGKCNHYTYWFEIPFFDPSEHSYNNPPWKDEHIYQYDEDELMDILNVSGFRINRLGHSNSEGGRHITVEAILSA